LLSGSLFYTINDSYSACFQVQDVKGSVENVGTSAMRSVMGNFPYDKVISDRNTINERLRTVIGKSIDQWGVECTRFEIQSFSPSNKNVEKQLELQMEAERNRRKQLLDTEATVNVSDGLKRSSILKSEGELINMNNQAEGQYKLKIRNAEAEKSKVDLETSALCGQISGIADSLGGDKLKAFEGILFLRQLEQMKAIAQGNNNSTYFFGEKSISGNKETNLGIDQHEVFKRALASK
jgi:regulator of protease activity HflC (stomatin/prohibitin superfamily)